MEPFDRTRRNFIKAAGVTGGALLMAGAIAGREAATAPVPSSSANLAPTALEMLKGVSDMHVHASPDTRPRAIDELSFVREVHAAGYRSVMFKSNDWSCHDRAYLTNVWGPDSGLPNFERLSDEAFAAYARIAPERSFITTDLGQVNMPHPLEGMRLCITELLKAGLPQKDIDLMVRANPAKLVGLDA